MGKTSVQSMGQPARALGVSALYSSRHQPPTVVLSADTLVRVCLCPTDVRTTRKGFPPEGEGKLKSSASTGEEGNSRKKTNSETLRELAGSWDPSGQPSNGH